MDGCPYYIGWFHVTEVLINSPPGKIIADVVRVTPKRVYGACTFMLTILGFDRLLQHSLRGDIWAAPVDKSRYFGFERKVNRGPKTSWYIGAY
jgi:hypothetical protein